MLGYSVVPRNASKGMDQDFVGNKDRPAIGFPQLI
jgi:hypothetical protein